MSENNTNQPVLTAQKKAIGWNNHRWALASASGLLSALLIHGHLVNDPHTFSIMRFLPNFFWQIAAAAAIVCIPLILILYKLAGKSSGTGLKKLYKAAMLFCFILLLFTAADRIVLNLLSMAVNSFASDKNPTGFIESIFYMAYKGRKIWLSGISGTLKLSLFGTIVGFILAVGLVFLRIQKPDERDSENVQLLKLIGSGFANLYVTIVRGTPMMVQVFIIYYSGFAIFRGLFPDLPISEINKMYSFFTAGLITVSLNTTAYLTEVLRGGIESLDKGQTEAARSLGMSAWQTMMKVVFPQAVKNSIPAIGNEFIINIKDTSVLNVIGVFETMYATSTIANTYYRHLETYVLSAIIYLILTFCLTRLLNFIAKKLDMPQSRGIPSSN